MVHFYEQVSDGLCAQYGDNELPGRNVREWTDVFKKGKASLTDSERLRCQPATLVIYLRKKKKKKSMKDSAIGREVNVEVFWDSRSPVLQYYQKCGTTVKSER